MKKYILVVLILTAAISYGCQQKEDNPKQNTEFDNGSNVFFPELSETAINNLELLGKLWGFLKYHHPGIGKGEYNWDYELFRILPLYLSTKNIQERDKALLDWINKFGSIPICANCRETSSSAYLKPNLLWAQNSNMSDDLQKKIQEIYSNRHQGKHYYISMVPSVGNPEFSNENPYQNMYYPDAGFRLLALYKYWSLIQYFFPNKYITDKNWDNVLKEYIPVFLSAKNRLEYELAAIQIIGEINDTHANLSGGGYEIAALRGSTYAPFRVWFIEGKLVVTDYYNEALSEVAGVKIGEVITHINGESIEFIVDSLKKFYPASNEAARLRDISFDLLRSNINSISITCNSSGQKEIPLYPNYMLSRYGSHKVNTSEKCYQLLDRNIGYLTLANIKTEDIAGIKLFFKDTKGVIIDIRNYPSTFVPFLLGSYFVSNSTPFVKFTEGNPNNPGEFTFTPALSVSPSGETYQGKLVVIVNEVTQSQAEYTSMAFRAGINTTVIGSTTAGADGNVSEFFLP
jgi:C-terminal processing protease CtpA/Prc